MVSLHAPRSTLHAPPSRRPTLPAHPSTPSPARRLSASVVIPARDAGATLPDSLAALSLADIPGPCRELVVVDDGSSDATASLAESFGAQVLRLPGRGPAAARNAGARASTGDILVFLDADCVPEPGCLDALLAPFDDPSIAAVRGAYTTDQRSLVARFTQLELEEKQARLAAARQVAVVDTACAAYRRNVFEALGGFDERFPATSAEDVDLSFRLAASGARIAFAPAARVRHRHPDRVSTYLWRKLRFGYFRAGLYSRHPDRLRDDGYTPRLMPLQIALAGLLALLLPASVSLPLVRRFSAPTLAAFLSASAPLVLRARRSDPSLAPFVPALLFLRSLAQGAGLAAGLAALAVHGLLGRRLRSAHSPPTRRRDRPERA